MAVKHFLRKKGTDEVYPFTDFLKERSDMEPVPLKEAQAILAANAKKKAATEVEDATQ